MGLTGATLPALGLAFIGGLANLVWLIPTQTLFMERVPGAFMGRVVSVRAAIVFGAMSAWMALASALVAVIPAAAVFVLFGTVSLGATILAARRRALHDPDSIALPEAVAR